MAARLMFEERCVIEAMIEVEASIQQIADALARHPSTVRREIHRGGGRDSYQAEEAQTDADQRASRPKTPKLVSDPETGEYGKRGVEDGMVSPCCRCRSP